MPDIVGTSDADEVKRARAKYLAIQRAKRRLNNRVGGNKCPNCGHDVPGDIDWEYDTLKPGLTALEERITVVGELPEGIEVEE